MLFLGATCGTLHGSVKGFDSDMKDGNSKSATIHCVVHTSRHDWHVENDGATVSVEIRFEGISQIRMLPSLHLISVPKVQGSIGEEYWAPFDIAAGSTVKAKQLLRPTGKTHSRSVRVIPSRLLWAPTQSSVWPSQTFAKTVPAGRYVVRVQVELEGGETITSNEVEIGVAK